MVFCFHCEEPIGPDDPVHRYPDGDLAHKNCFMRTIIGSVAHIERRCGCYVPDSEENDPEGLTLRQAADAAVAAWERQQRLLVN